MSGLWVFAYGSLMWNPEFEYTEQHRARLDGYARRMCLWSVLYRGSPESPGLVLGLDKDPEASCIGIAYRIAPENAVRTTELLAEREMSTYAYREERLPVTLLGEGGRELRRVRAICYVMDPGHPQYAGGISEEESVAIIARSCGDRGDNREYLEHTLRSLQDLGVRERALERLGERVAQIGTGER